MCAISSETRSIELLTSYRRERGSTELYNVTKIWEAARATSAASTFFEPITIGPNNERFLDGGTGANNPVRYLWEEALDIWGSDGLDKEVDCIVSIGTGVPSVKKFGEEGKFGLKIFKTLKDIATETEDTARAFHREHTRLDDENKYFRFNVPDGLGEVGLEEVSEINSVVAQTRRYLEGEAVHKQIRVCARVLHERECASTFA